MALVGVLLQVTMASEPADKEITKDLKAGDVDGPISSALRQLSAAIYNKLSRDQKSSMEEVQFKLASLFNDLQGLCQSLSTESNDLAGLNTEARKILETILESMHGPGGNNSVLGSLSPIISNTSSASDDSKDARPRPLLDATLRNVEVTHLTKADRYASCEGDSQKPCVQNSVVFGTAGSRYGFLNDAIDAKRNGDIDGAPHDEHVRELHTTLSNADRKAWSTLIHLALMKAPGHRMSLQEIYTWMIQHTDKVKEPGDGAWKNSIRHNLSINDDFIRVPNADSIEDCHTFQCWTISLSAIERGATSTTSHRKNTEEKTSRYEFGGNDRGMRNSVSPNYGLVILDCSAPQSILESHTAQNYNAERTRIASEPFDRDIGNYGMDRHQSLNGSVNGWDPRSLSQCSSSCPEADDVSQSIDGCGRAAPKEVRVDGNDIGIMFTQAAFERFVCLWEMYMQGATPMLEIPNDNPPSKPDKNEVCTRLIQVKMMRTVRSGFGPLFDLHQARLKLMQFYEPYAEFKAQVQARITGAEFENHCAIPLDLDDLNDPIVLQRAQNALASRKCRHKKNLLIEDLTDQVKELEGDLEQIGSRQQSIAPGADSIERDVISDGVANFVNKLLVNCLNARTGNNFTPKQRVNRKRDIVRFSIEAKMYAPFVKSFGLGILALMPQQCRFRLSKSDMKQKGSDMERDILSFVNENPRSVEFCRIIEEEYMTVVRHNSNATQPDPRHDVRLQMILASISLGTLEYRSQTDSPANLPEPFPGQGKVSRLVREHMQESYTTDRLPCIVCKLKNIHCSHKIDLSACEECRKKGIRCIEEMPSAEHYQLSSSGSPSSVDSSKGTGRDLGRSVESITLQHRSIIDLTRDDEVAGPTIAGSTPYVGSALKCRGCGKTADCAWRPGSKGYRLLCDICGQHYLMGKLGITNPNIQPPINNHGARHFSPALNNQSELFNGDGAVIGKLGTTSPVHQSTGKKRRASASETIQEDQDAIKRAKNREKCRKYQAKKAQEIEDLKARKEALEAAWALLESARGSG